MAAPSKLVIVDDRSLEVLDEILSTMADTLDLGIQLDATTLGHLKSLACKARAILLEDRDAGALAWKMIEDATA